MIKGVRLFFSVFTLCGAFVFEHFELFFLVLHLFVIWVSLFGLTLNFCGFFNIILVFLQLLSIFCGQFEFIIYYY